MEDSQIVGLYWERNESAIQHTDKKYGHYLGKIAFQILNDKSDSEESVNDTYLAAWDSIPPQRPNVLSTYLGKLTRRISIDRFRKKTAQKRGAGEYEQSLDELSECISGGGTPEETVEAQLLGEAIGRFLHTLSPEARHTFIGRYYYLDSIREVAAYCHISESKAKILLHRTRLALRTYLEKEGYIV